MIKPTAADRERQQTVLRDRGICVVIPTYNNAETIGMVVRSALEECRDVIVVNDGSTDGTSDVLHSIAGITLVEYARNHGKGYALRKGFGKAQEMGFTYAITMDGDGQHYAREIRAFLEANRRWPGALITGSRRMEGVDRSRGSRFANAFSNFWFWVQTGRRLPDTQTGFRLYPLRRLCGLRLITARYEAELELLVFAAWHGVEIASIPIDVFYPPREERVSHFRPVADFVRISVLNTVLCFLAVVYGWPLMLLRRMLGVLRTVYSVLMVLLFSFGVLTPLVWLYVKTGAMTERKRYNLHRLICWVSRFVVLWHGIPGVRFTWGKDPTEKRREWGKSLTEKRREWGNGCVVICNHQSHLDLVCQLWLTPRLVFLTNDWVWRNPLYGVLIRNAEFYPVRDGLEVLLPRLRSLVERGYCIGVYPEGTRSRDGRIGRFHQGAFWIAEQLGVDVVPMCLYGTGRVLRKGEHHLNRGRIHVEVGDPVTQEELQAMGGARQQASVMRRRYVEWYERMTAEIEREI